MRRRIHVFADAVRIACHMRRRIHVCGACHMRRRIHVCGACHMSRRIHVCEA
jgi:hypothetical protein